MLSHITPMQNPKCSTYPLSIIENSIQEAFDSLKDGYQLIFQRHFMARARFIRSEFAHIEAIDTIDFCNHERIVIVEKLRFVDKEFWISLFRESEELCLVAHGGQIEFPEVTSNSFTKEGDLLIELRKDIEIKDPALKLREEILASPFQCIGNGFMILVTEVVWSKDGWKARTVFSCS